MTTRKEIIARARSWVGTPYRPQGRKRGVDGGGDCIAVLEDIGLHFGMIAKPVQSVYSISEASVRDILRGLTQSGCVRHIQVNQRRPGDILFFRYSSIPTHLGVMTGPLSVVHAHQDVGQYIESALFPSLSSRISSAWIFPGVED